MKSVRSWLMIILLLPGIGVASTQLPSTGEHVADDRLLRQAVARYFELTDAISVKPIKKRVGSLINRKLKQNNSGVRQLHYDTVKAVVDEEVNLLSEDAYFFEIYYQAYIKHFTLEDMQEINRFFASEAGKKFISTRSALHKDVSTSTVKMIHHLVDRIAPKVQLSLAKSGVQVSLD